MARKKVGWGIVGCGVIGPWHARAVEHSGNTELKAVCDVVPERAKALAEKHNAAWFTDYKEMLKQPDIECVSVCTPSGMHADHGILAAKHGKHVLCEKPIDIQLRKIDKLIDTCRTEGVKLSCIFQRRTYDSTKQARRAMEKGVLGQMVMAAADARYYRSPDYYLSGDWRGTWKWDGGGALMNQGVHVIDQLLYIMGDVTEVFAYADHLVRDIEVEDTCVATFKFKNGAIGVLKGATSVNPGETSGIALHGNNGTIIVEDRRLTKWAVSKKEAARAKPKEGGQEVKSEAVGDPTAIGVAGHIEQVKDLAIAIRRDRDPMVTGESARKSVELIVAIYHSAHTGRPVKLDSFKEPRGGARF